MNRLSLFFTSLKSLIVVACIMCTTVVVAQGRRAQISNMRCEYSVEPISIDQSKVRFTWTYDDVPRDKGFEQLTAEVRVAQNEEDLKSLYTCVATSGRVNTSRSRIDMLTLGLEPHQRYCWQVRLYNGMGIEMMHSDVAWFSTAKLHGVPWDAKWITDGHDKNHRPAPMLRRAFNLKGDVATAMLYISAAGYYDAKINGSKVGDDYLSPAFTQYDKRNMYMSYDVTDQLHAGANVISATLGNGFYNEYTGMTVWQ